MCVNDRIKKRQRVHITCKYNDPRASCKQTISVTSLWNLGFQQNINYICIWPWRQIWVRLLRTLRI
jgi:hypothetical protein